MFNKAKIAAHAKPSADRLSIAEWMYVAIVFAVMVGWASVQVCNHAPDEFPRAAVAAYIFHNGALPVGWDMTKETFVFAFRFTFLPSLVQALGAGIASIFTSESFGLLLGARIAGSFFGAIAVVFSIKVAHRAVSGPARLVLVGLAGLIPQFIFLGSYANSDIFCVAGAAISLYAWTVALDEGWGYKPCLTLAAGTIVIGLSYYNGYGWIIASVILFILSFVVRKESPRKYAKPIALALSLIVVIIGVFVVRNALLYNGDLFGFSSSVIMERSFASDAGYEVPADCLFELGYGFTDFITANVPEEIYGMPAWTFYSAESFIGCFGYMLYWLSAKVYWCYGLIFLIGAVAFVIGLVVSVVRREITSKDVLLGSCIFFVFLITLVVDVYFTLSVTNGYQGRYMFPALLPIILVVAKGYQYLFSALPEKVGKVLAIVIFVCLAILLFYVTVRFYLPNASSTPGAETVFMLF